jgi:hypothetical protein
MRGLAATVFAAALALGAMPAAAGQGCVGYKAAKVT